MFQVFELQEFRNLEHLMFQGSAFLAIKWMIARGRKVETFNVSSFRASGIPKLGTFNVSRFGLPRNLTDESREAGRLKHGMFQAFELPGFRNLEQLMFQGSGFLSII